MQWGVFTPLHFVEPILRIRDDETLASSGESLNPLA